MINDFVSNYNYLVLYLDTLNFKCFAGFTTKEEAREYLNEISKQYITIGIAELAKPISY